MWAPKRASARSASQHPRSRAPPSTHPACRARSALKISAIATEPASTSTPPTGRRAWGEPILVCGAGIAGLATALALSKLGLPVRVFESRRELRREGAALSLWSNAWRSLEALLGPEGAGELRRGHQLLTRVELCASSGELLRAFQLAECDLGPEGSETRGLMRATLLQALYDSLPDRESIVEFGTSVREVLAPPQGASGGGGDGAPDGPVAVRLSDGRTVYGSVLVGSDGVGSEVARYLQLPAPRYSGYCAYRGVATFPNLDPDSGAAGSGSPGFSGSGPGGLRLDTIRQLWGAGVRAGLYPITPTTFYWFTCFNADTEASRQPPPSPAERQRAALESVAGWGGGGGIQQVISATPAEEISWSRISDRWTYGTFGRGLVTLAGDAAHPMTPNLGQGGCTALEDAVVLARKLGKLAEGSAPPSPADLASALRSYEYERSSRCLPLTVRANLMGAALQSSLPVVVAARDAFVRTAFSPGHFLDHTVYDCGRLDEL
ncbi:hypothetical protein PLESTB_000596200 [Pleodorina starrii]|uniref:FAD-binding domain-containing protein n=1 Tax=Pleodorina starrii TaxID=330485 RepID=A0A9W6BHQ3_9CHLO|nr:hypothetical protein PLESTB_000596200 [Pleodorina starrii]